MKRKFKTAKLFLIIIFVIISTSCNIQKVSNAKLEPSEKSIAIFMEANALTDKFEYKDARKLLEDNYETLKDNEAALNAYGFWESHIFGDYERAEQIYKDAININPDNPQHHMGLGYVYEAWENYEKAIDSYNKAVANIKSYKNVPLNSQLSFAYKNIGRCYLKLNDYDNAVKYLEKSAANNPYGIETNEKLHKLYVEKGNYAKAYEVWKNDNLFNDMGESIYESLIDYNQKYKKLAENSNNLNHIEIASLYDSLALYDEAAMEYEKSLAENRDDKDIISRLDEVKAFIEFRDELTVLLDDYYRDRCINGSSAELNYYNRIKTAYDKIAVIFPNIVNKAKITVWVDSLNGEIEKKFNVVIKNILANQNLLGAHFGRVVDISTIHTSQWGKEIDLKVTTLKNMYSNGVDFWRSMENSGVGGWSEGMADIVRVIMNNETENGLNLATIYNEDSREDFFAMGIDEDKLTQEEKGPLELYFSPEIRKQFLIKTVIVEAEKGRQQGLKEDELQKYIYDKIIKDFAIKTSIYVHESQHSIDTAMFVKFNWFGENEYRPKISQLAYGHLPFMSLSNYYNSTVGTDMHDSHNMANTRVFKDIIQYIYDNSSEFPQIDTAKNILSQLIHLSEQDIKEIAIAVYEKNYPKEKYQ